MIRFLIITLILLTISVPSAYGQTKTPTKNAIPTSEEIEKISNKVDALKNKVASRVAELNLIERRGIIGIVEDVNDTQITITDLNNKTRIIDVDELTKFSSEDDDSFGISDIKKGSRISALGLYNKESHRLLARFVNEKNLPLFLHGIITETDEDEFTATLLTEDGKEYLIDVEKITKTFTYNDGELDTSGFSKIEKMQNGIVIGFLDPKENNRLTASRIITFPDLPANPNIPVMVDNDTKSTPTPTPEEEEE
ncbi:MAG: hypothetical protein KBD51_03725 [Candidatus Levybacteria bacterium]|nr:hypothetical protein [Candidatus Levybacteria bacterium]